MESVERVLTVVRQELAADDARIELGGRPPRGDRAVFIELDEGFRLVALFDEPIDDAPRRREKLATLVESFHATLEELRRASPVPPVAPEATARAELRLTLDVLCERTKAAAAVVVDEQSPAVWGTSAHAAWLDDARRAQTLGNVLETAAQAGFDTAGWLAVSDAATPALPRQAREDLVAHRPALGLLLGRTTAPRARLALLRAVALARGEHDVTVRGDDFGAITRRFAGIYRLALAFETDYSELHAEATLARALPVIERLVHDLPPIDPTPKGARVFRFQKKKE